MTPYCSAPFDALSLFTSGCMSATVTPDLFIAEPANVVMAFASPVVPALDCIMVPPPIMPPPPMPLIEMDVEPIIPFITPSAASFIMAVTIPEEELVMPTVLAYSDMAAMLMP